MDRNKAFLLADKLESRGYRQGIGALKKGPRTFCCLGVACQITGLKAKDSGLGEYIYDDENAYLPKSVIDFFDFYNKKGTRRDNVRIEIDDNRYLDLADANDAGVPFKKIAKYIRKNYKDL